MQLSSNLRMEHLINDGGRVNVRVAVYLDQQPQLILEHAAIVNDGETA
jgi:hypothetical protein